MLFDLIINRYIIKQNIAVIVNVNTVIKSGFISIKSFTLSMSYLNFEEFTHGTA